MLNVDRAEFGPQPAQEPEKPRKNGHIPSWARVPAFALRASLAILTATPGMVVAADVINRMDNSAVVYNSDQKIIVGPQYDFDQPELATATPTPTTNPLSPLTYNVKLCRDGGDLSCTGSFSGLTQCFAAEKDIRPTIPVKLCTGSDREYIYIEVPRYGVYSNTGITLKAGQNMEISATGRIRIHSPYSTSTYYSGSCHNWDEVDPDGNRYLPPLDVRGHEHTFRWDEVYPDGNRSLHDSDTICFSTNTYEDSERFYIGAPRGSLIGNIGGLSRNDRCPEILKGSPEVGCQATLIGNHWKGSANIDGTLNLGINFSSPLGLGGAGEMRGFDITVKVYPPTPSIASPKPILTPDSIQTKVTTPAALVSPSSSGSTDQNHDLVGWLGGLGAAIFAGLAAYKLSERWRLRKGVGAGSTAVTSTSFDTDAIPKIAGVAGVLRDPSNPNTAPSIRPTQPKNPEWIIGQKDFERRWQTAKSKLSPIRPGDNGNEPGYILDRFKAGMNIIHEVSLDDSINAPEMNTRIRAGIEYLIPEIWPNNRIFKGFFDPGFNAGYLTPTDLAKIIYLPESYRNLSSFTKGQKTDVMRIRRMLLHALHPDLLKSDADPKLQDSIDILLKQLNTGWSLINKLIS